MTIGVTPLCSDIRDGVLDLQVKEITSEARPDVEGV